MLVKAFSEQIKRGRHPAHRPLTAAMAQEPAAAWQWPNDRSWPVLDDGSPIKLTFLGLTQTHCMMWVAHHQDST